MASKIVRNISRPLLSNTNRLTRLSECNSSHMTWLKLAKNIDPVIFVKKNTYESKKQFTSSTSKYNEMENIISTEAILLSDSCVERIKEIADDTSYLRVMVEGGGCSGFQYKFELESNNINDEEDRIFERNGAKLVVDETSFEYLKVCINEYRVSVRQPHH